MSPLSLNTKIIGICETQNLAEYSDNIFQEKPLRHGAETIKNRRTLCPSVFCPAGLSGMLGVRRLCMEDIVRIFSQFWLSQVPMKIPSFTGKLYQNKSVKSKIHFSTVNRIILIFFRVIWNFPLIYGKI